MSPERIEMVKMIEKFMEMKKEDIIENPSEALKSYAEYQKGIMKGLELAIQIINR